MTGSPKMVISIFFGGVSEMGVPDFLKFFWSLTIETRRKNSYIASKMSKEFSILSYSLKTLKNAYYGHEYRFFEGFLGPS